ncbi:hypothetical protein CQJ94_04950 [Glycomyces fuscus]|nr:hypothetical protein CQJ94_04950 [Glycomyces fuscus]
MTDFVSLNGPDNSGKSTQVRMLAHDWHGFHDLGPVHRHDPVPWSRVSGAGYGAWWFTTSTTEELTHMLFSSHTVRARARPPGKIGLLDRGWYTLLATAVATCAVKESLPVEAAWTRVLALVDTDEPYPPEFPVLLLPALDTEQSIATAQQREGHPWTGVYLDYQRHLHRVLLLMARRGVFAEVVSGQTRGIDTTQALLRRALAAHGIGAPSIHDHVRNGCSP